MLRKLAMLCVAAALLTFCGHALAAFDAPQGAAVIHKVRRSLIRVSGTSIAQPVAFMAGEGGGSGVVFQIDYDKRVAYALTNYHVSGESPLSTVRFWDQAEYKAYMVATDPGIDVALLEIQGIPDERNLPDDKKTIIAAPLGSSNGTQIGEFAVAMGSPGSMEGVDTNKSDPWQGFMLQQTATMRVVTGKDDDVSTLVSTSAEWAADLGTNEMLSNLPWRFVVQSAINGGNSGGPLFNMRGECIGLNHANYGAGSVITQNQNWTIPIDFAKNLAYQYLNTGHYDIPWLGLDVLIPPNKHDPQNIEEWFERFYKADQSKVFGVRKDSPALRAGFKANDIILEFDGQRFPTNTDLRSYMFNLPIGKKVPVTVLRGGQKVPLTAEVGVKRHYDSEFSI